MLTTEALHQVVIYFTGAICAGILFIAKKLFNKIDCFKKEQKIQSLALQSLLRNNILKIYYKYKDNKKIPLYELDNVKSLHSEYNALKGNGVIEKVMEDIAKWEVVRFEDLK